MMWKIILILLGAVLVVPIILGILYLSIKYLPNTLWSKWWIKHLSK